MQITKLGHCCLVIKIDGMSFLTDPGAYSTGQESVTGIDCVVITHEHADHFHLDSLAAVLKNNPQATVVANGAVGKLLEDAKLLEDGHVKYQKVAHGDRTAVATVELAGYGTKHAVIYKEFGQVENTGYFFGNKLFYPGDAFYKPDRAVDILALPVAGPWCKISEAIEYALDVKPHIAFPVHDALLSDLGSGLINRIMPTFFSPAGITFKPIPLKQEMDFS